MAATMNTTLERMKGEVIGKELRAVALSYLGDFNTGPGLSCYAPMINIIRDPM
jgi:beta-glucosidase-like glycosyl hydrolase